MMNLSGSLRYDMHGRKRKSKTSSPAVRARKADFKPMEISRAEMARRAEADAHLEKYPSGRVDRADSASADTSWKVEESKNFTVAPAYNKGAYQVIPSSSVKDIGR